MPNPRKDLLEDKQCVILKGRRDGISILLDDKADFGLIRDVLRKRVASSRGFFEGAKATVTFKGRKLTSSEEESLLSIIQHEANLHVAPDDDTPEHDNGSITNKLRPTAPNTLVHIESATFYYRGHVRSGQTITQNGSIVVQGDINPGAEVKATGNIIVLGSLRGTAWAGAPGHDDENSGDDTCFISAYDFRPTQIRIDHYVTYIPDDAPQDGNGAWAYIQDKQVYIVPL